MNSSFRSAKHRAALNPALFLYRDRFECSMAVPAFPEEPPRLPSSFFWRRIAISIGAVAITLAFYFTQGGH